MLVGFGWMGQAHMQQMAATGVARTVGPAASSIGVASGAAGGMADRWMAGLIDDRIESNADGGLDGGVGALAANGCNRCRAACGIG